jgi:uncharacterized protein YacL
MITCEQCQPFISYRNSLSQEQLKIYQMVSKERLMLAIQGLALGIFLSFVVLLIYKNTLNPVSNACLFTAIALFTQYLYYMLTPKLSMLQFLDNKEQVNEWYKVYRFMQNRYHMGMLFGAIGYFLLGFGLSC